jgi:hypothetical protein
MKLTRYVLAVLAFASVGPTQAQNRVDRVDQPPAGVVRLPSGNAIGGAELIVYRFPGVYDNGGSANTGVAASFHCTNFSGVSETFRFVTRDANGTLLTNVAFSVPHLATITASTHATLVYNDSATSLGTGPITQGTTAIAATSRDVVCTAVTIDATLATPTGIALRGVRFNPAPDSQE